MVCQLAGAPAVRVVRVSLRLERQRLTDDEMDLLAQWNQVEL